MPPSPKAPGARRRRNAGQSQWKELPAGGRPGDCPVLPGDGWSAETLGWWATIWASPMATIWVDADFDGLVRLAVLREQFHAGELSVSAYGAITTLEDRFGLSPKARRALQWEIAQGEVVDHPSRVPARKLRAVESA